MSLRIIFMGTPQFAAHILSSLIASEHQIVGVYTKPPTLSGRGMKSMPSHVQLIADEHQIPVFTPRTLKEQEEIDKFTALNADIAVVVAYGLILRAPILEGAKYGCINVHPSALPRWRGAAPIQRAIMAGDKQTAICIMKMDEGIDTGDIILKQEIQLDETITAQELFTQVAELSGPILLEALSLIQYEKVRPYKQNADGMTYAHKITKAEERLEWHNDARDLHNQIRALSPRPGAYFIYNDEIIKIITAEYDKTNHGHTPGTVIDARLSIACGTGVLRPQLLQRQGRKMIYVDAFLRGCDVPIGAIL